MLIVPGRRLPMADTLRGMGGCFSFLFIQRDPEPKVVLVAMQHKVRTKRAPCFPGWHLPVTDLAFLCWCYTRRTQPSLSLPFLVMLENINQQSGPSCAHCKRIRRVSVSHSCKGHRSRFHLQSHCCPPVLPLFVLCTYLTTGAWFDM